jgi:hypothetical protein
MMAEQTIDYEKLAKACAPYINQPKVVVPEPVVDDNELAEGTALVDGEIIYTDPTAKTCDEVEAKALNSLPMGHASYRSKNGTVMVNHSAESLDAVMRYRRAKRQSRTRSYA